MYETPAISCHSAYLPTLLHIIRYSCLLARTMRVGVTRGLGPELILRRAQVRGGQPLSYVPGYWLIWVANEMFGQSLRVSKVILVVNRGNWKEVGTILRG